MIDLVITGGRVATPRDTGPAYVAIGGGFPAPDGAVGGRHGQDRDARRHRPAHEPPVAAP